MKTSIIVPLWNHLEDLTIPFLAQIVKTKGNWELILVDNGSTDGTPKYIKELENRDKRIKVILNDINQGFSGGNNTGYGRAVGPLICFISNDVVIRDSTWLENFVTNWKTNPKSLIGPQLVKDNSLTIYHYQPTPYLTGHCIFGPKELFDKIKFKNQVWDESFGKAYFEDTWLSVLAVDAGYQLLEVISPLEHLGSKSSDQIDIPIETKQSQLVFHNKMLIRELRQKGKKRYVFFVPGVPYPFVDGDYEGKGVGGAEASLILLARELAKSGNMVEIYNKTEFVGNFNGVDYHNLNEFNYTDYCDAFILFRSYHPVLEVVNAKKKIFWSCDQVTDFSDVWQHCVFPNVDLIVAISSYHKSFLEREHKCNKRIEVIDLGINYSDYKDNQVPKTKGRAIYCSVPGRGLSELLDMAPIIKSQIPEFELVVTSDYRLWGLDEPDNYAVKSKAEGYDYVKFLGKIPRSELIDYQKSSEIMAYPATYEECFCISAMECMAAGAVPITIDKGALKTTVGNGGLVLSNNISQDEYIKSVVRLFKDNRELNCYRQAGYKIAKAHAWEKIVKKWLELFKEKTMTDMTIRDFCNLYKVTPGYVKKFLNIAPKTKNTYLYNYVLSEEKLNDLKISLTIDKKPVDEPVKPAEIKLPIASMPKIVVLRTKVPISCSINGKFFNSVPTLDGNRIEVDYDYLTSVVQIIRESYGDVIV
jgi:glycosyltransferase involved in cell wall biosynthesis